MTSASMRTIGDVVAASSLKGKVRVLEISVDAERDTQSRLMAYQKLYDDNNWTLASGLATSLDTLWKYLGAPATRTIFSDAELKKLPVDWQTGKPGAYNMIHPDLVLIIDAKSHWRWLDLGNPNPGKAKIPVILKAYLSEDGLNNLAKPQESSWSTDAVFSALLDITGVKIN